MENAKLEQSLKFFNLLFQWIVFGPGGRIGILVQNLVAMALELDQDQKLGWKKMVDPVLVKRMNQSHAL